jgi:hypothetical protein
MPSLVTNHSPPCAIGELVEGSVVLDPFDDKPGRGACSEANFAEYLFLGTSVKRAQRGAARGDGVQLVILPRDLPHLGDSKVTHRDAQDTKVQADNDTTNTPDHFTDEGGDQNDDCE